jgi:hypothetical protein
MASMDIRRRVAWRIAREHGWDPASVSVWVVVAPARTNARILADHSTVLRRKFPADGRSMRRWLSRPSEEIAALSFLPDVRAGNLGRDLATPRRVRPAGARSPSLQKTPRQRRPPRVGVAFRE